MLHGKISFTIVQNATLFFPNRAVTINVRLIVEIFEMTLLKTNPFELSDRGGGVFGRNYIVKQTHLLQNF